MGRCNNRRTQQAAEVLKNTPARARFSAPPPHRRKSGGCGGRGGRTTEDAAAPARGQPSSSRRTTTTQAASSVVAKISKRVGQQQSVGGTATSLATTAASASSRNNNPLAGVDLSKLDSLTLTEQSIALITQLLKDLDVVDTFSSSSPSNPEKKKSPTSERSFTEDEEFDSENEAGDVLNHDYNINRNDNNAGASESVLSATATEWVMPSYLNDEPSSSSGAPNNTAPTTTSIGYHEYEEDGDDEIIPDTSTATTSNDVANGYDETEWMGNSKNDEDDHKAIEALLSSQDPVFLHLTQRLSFGQKNAAQACRAIENWSAVVTEEASSNNQTTTSQTKAAARLGNVMDWLCLHLSEDKLKAGFRSNPATENGATKQISTGSRQILLAGTGRTKPIPHPSISVAKKLTEDAEWSRMARLEERTVGFLRLGFLHGEALKALQETDREGIKTTVAAVDDSDTIRRLLGALERDVLLQEKSDNNDEVAAFIEANEEEKEAVQVEREMEREALAAIYEAGFQVLELSESGYDRYKISMMLDGISSCIELLVFLRPGYPLREPPLFLVYNPDLPWPFLRQMNSALVKVVSELGVAGPLVFEIASFVSENLVEKLAAFQRSQKAKEFEQVQLRLRKDAGHQVENHQDLGHDSEGQIGRRQRARMKIAERAFDSLEKEKLKAEERKRIEKERLEKIKDEERNLRQSMAERAISRREHERHQEELRKVGRSAMNAAFNRGENTEQAREAARRAETAYREAHGLEHVAVSSNEIVCPPGAVVTVDERGDEEEGDDASDEAQVENELIKATPTTAAFMERLRSMYASAAQEKQQVILNEPKKTLNEPKESTDKQGDYDVPKPVCPLTDQEVKDMMDDIIEQQREQPWLVSDEARVPSKQSSETPAQNDSSFRRNEINRQLKKDFERKNPLNSRVDNRSKRGELSSQQAKIQEQRERLPAFSMRTEIVKTVKDNQITLIKGSTGCGKTTQVPQFVLGDMIANSRGAEANIIVTQPRRISAMGVAERIAAELGEKVGQTCGYSIKLEKKCSRNTRILLCTTGILLRRLQIDPDLATVSHVFIDEVHERDMLTDFILIVLKQLAERRKSLKLVLMSATVNAETFSNYFGGCGEVEIPGRTFPVQEFRLEDILHQVGYEVKEGSDYAVKAAAKNNVGRLSKSALKKLYQPKYDSKVIHSLSIVDENVINYELLTDLLEYIVLTTEETSGAILVFLPGMAEITKAVDEMRRKELFQGDRVAIYPLHSTLSTSEQKKVFEVPPEGVRKIVVSTNIAETSITIEDVVYVVDSGRVKENRRDEVKETPALVDCWVSRSSAKQRRGRSGRVRPGIAYHMFSSHTYENDLQEYTLPEMLRVGVEDLTLQILILDLGEPHKFLGKAVNPPSGLAMKNALSLLEELGAIECTWHTEESDVELCSDLDVSVELTALGFHLATLPVEPRIGKIMIYGAILGCVEDALTIAASMSSKNFFASSFDNRDSADAARKSLSMDDSDHLTVLAVFNEWQETKAKKGIRQAQEFMRDNFLNRSALFQMEELRKQYSRLLVDIGFLSKNFALSRYKDIRKADSSLIKAVLCAGLYPNIIVAPKSLLSRGSKQRISEVAFQSRRRGDVFLHPSTLSASATTLSSRYLCFHEIVKTSKIYIRDCTAVTPFSLLLFGGALRVYHREGVITVDQWLKFRISAKSATLVKYLRAQMESMLLKKIVSPDEGDGLSRHSDALIKAVGTLLQSEKPSSQSDTTVSCNDGAEIVRPWHGSEHEVARSGRGGGRGRWRGGRGRGRSSGRGRR